MTSKKAWIVGSGLVFPAGNASTNRLTEIAYGFQENGWQVKFIPLGGAKYRGVDLIGHYRGIVYEYFDDIQSNLSPVVKFLFSGILLKKHIEGLKKIIVNEGVTLIFCGTSSPYSLYLLKSLAKIANITFVYDIVEDPLASWLNKDIVQFSSKQKVQHLFNLIKIPIYYFVAWHFPDFITTISKPQYRRLKKLGFTEKNIFLFPIVKYCSDIESNFLEGDNSNYNTLIHSGSTYFPKDGVNMILEAVKILIQRGIDIRMEFFGAIGQYEKGKIDDFAKMHELTDVIKVRGLVELQDLFSAQKKSLALICFKPLNMQNRYNFATKIIDYLDSGRPVILSNLPVYREYFENDENAFISDEIDAQSLARIIDRVYCNPQKANEVGINGKALLKSEFSAELLVGKLLERINL